jgi:hypothetical protein
MVKKNYRLNDKQQRRLEKLMEAQKIDSEEIDYFVDSILLSRYNLILKSDKAARVDGEIDSFNLKALEGFFILQDH